MQDFFNITALTSGTTAYDPVYGYFWTSTSAYQNARSPGYYYAWYVAFGTAPDPDGNDTHGAGGVRFDVKAEGGPREFKTSHFVFESDHDVSAGFIAEAALVFEGTLQAVKSLPLGIEPTVIGTEKDHRIVFLLGQLCLTEIGK